jgi:hypothetical protein
MPALLAKEETYENEEHMLSDHGERADAAR